MAPHAAHLRAGVKMGDIEVRRHHAQGRADRRLPRLPHGQHGRERRGASGRSPARSRTSSPPPRRTRPRPPRRRAASRTRSSPVTVKTRKGDIVVDEDEYIRHGTTLRRGQAAARLLEGRHGDGRQRLRHQRRRGGRRAHDGREGREARPQAARPHRLLGDRRRRSRRSWARARSRPRARRSRRPAGRSSDLDLVEANEAFAAQALAVNKDMGWTPRR